MQDYGNSKLLTGKTIVFFIVLMIVAFLPVISFLFFLKNDAFNGYFPPKFFMSESLHNGILPLWNPYINFGLPQYGDMSSSYWSPITWIIAVTVGYNAYSFTIEVLLYLFIAGIGMFALCRFYQFKNIVCLIAGASYMCSGYMVGHMQHFNWISGAAFLPCSLWAYKKLLQDFTLKKVIIAALIFYLLIASAHPGITIGAIYFFAAYAIFDLFSGEQKTVIKKIPGFLKTNLVLILSLLILSSGLIMGYADILPHFTRAAKPAMEAIVSPGNAKTWMSFLIPMATVKNNEWFATDISMRNLYIGITLLVFFLYALINKKLKEQQFYLGAGIFFLLLASGGWLTGFLYWLPLLGYVRLPGEFTIFSLLAFILVAAFSLNQLIKENIHPLKLSLIIRSTAILLLLISCWAFSKIIFTHNSLLYKYASAPSENDFTGKLKMIIDSISFYDAALLQGSFQLLLLGFIAHAIRNRNYTRFVLLVATDLIMATLLNLPFTAVGQASVKNIQEVLNESPIGIPIPALQPIINNDTGRISQTSLVGNWSFYNKQPGVASNAYYPIELNSTKKIFSASNQNNFLKPLVFSTNNSSVISINKFTGQQIKLDVKAIEEDTLVWQQSNYPHWKVYIDENPAQLIEYRGIYLATIISPENHKVDFVFSPDKIKAAMLISGLAILLCIVYLMLIWIFPSWQQKRLRP